MYVNVREGATELCHGSCWLLVEPNAEVDEALVLDIAIDHTDSSNEEMRVRRRRNGQPAMVRSPAGGPAVLVVLKLVAGQDRDRTSQATNSLLYTAQLLLL